MKFPEVSVIIPTLNEETNVANAIQSAWAAGAYEVIIADGGSQDATVAVAEKERATIVRSLPGRGVQLKNAANVTVGQIIVMLHADSKLQENAFDAFCELEEDKCWGCFRQSIDDARRIYRVIEFGNLWRCRLFRLVYGDQAIWVRRQQLKAIGGVPEVPLMEDVLISRLLSRRWKPTVLNRLTITSSRRWQQEGIINRTLKNWILLFRFLVLRTPPESLLRKYQPNQDNGLPRQSTH